MYRHTGMLNNRLKLKVKKQAQAIWNTGLSYPEYNTQASSLGRMLHYMTQSGTAPEAIWKSRPDA